MFGGHHSCRGFIFEFVVLVVDIYLLLHAIAYWVIVFFSMFYSTFFYDYRSLDFFSVDPSYPTIENDSQKKNKQNKQRHNDDDDYIIETDVILIDYMVDMRKKNDKKKEKKLKVYFR